MRIKPGSVAYNQAREAFLHWKDQHIKPSAGAVAMRAMHISGKRPHPFVECKSCSYFADHMDICPQGLKVVQGTHECHRYNPKEFHDAELLKDVQWHIERQFKE